MKPNASLIKLNNNSEQITRLLTDLVLRPRLKAIEWSQITKQTPNIKIGYPGQHLASLITGMEGERTGARGNDLVDGSEVKSCSRIDQLDKCGNAECGAPVARLEIQCSTCGSKEIKRNNDSKWLFTIRSEGDLETLVRRVPRIVLVLGDYPDFAGRNFERIRFQAFEIWPRHPRNARFAEIMTNYYKNIYLKHKDKDAAKTPAPKNFWPDQYQFYVCNPIRIFLCEVDKANTAPELRIEEFVDPAADRESVASIGMPATLLNAAEKAALATRAPIAELRAALPKEIRLNTDASAEQLVENLTNVDEPLRKYLDLRDTDRIATASKPYSRRGQIA